ncbi:GH25 family lysozyme [Weissella paramesenteroides]|uniref:GH25 family lysozyme n=1 Tax=Weissella paramesenteroides TaxID=1249 RepID=UPI0023A9929B|nr:GH25 family lysozyme [Weissella paramesenteroides]WEA53674.1 GH25 family lysozyme [Weissella paramesenteroides]
MHYFKQLILVLIISILSIAVLVHRVYATGVPSITAGQAGTPRTDFVDVSSWNGRLTTADFDNMKSHGVRGVIVKLTEGTYYINPNAQAQIASAQAAELRIAVYHYSKYQTPVSAINEADYFTTFVKKYGLTNNTVLVDDLEDSATRQGDVTQNALAFRDRLAANGYQRYMLYTSPTYYWFTNGVRQNSQWQTAWGYRYYVDAEGRAVQGIQQIGENNYYFGDNGTHFLRTINRLR